METLKTNKLRIAGFNKDSIVDGPGLRYTIFSQGCFHNCEGCHNPQTHDITAGKIVDIDEILEDINNIPICDGVTFSGGEPFLQADTFADLAVKIKNSNHPLDIICYTGWTWEEIQEIISNGFSDYMRLLRNIDYLIDGRFDKNKVSLDCNWRGSTNQRIIDVQKSLETGEIVEVDI